MKTRSIIIFYKYIHLPNPAEILKWQKKLCQKLGLKGRIILAREGINATLGGFDEALERYRHAMDGHSLFNDIDYKYSKNTADHFPRLRIVVKNEIVNIGLGDSAAPFTLAGPRLEPRQAHELLEKKPDNMIVLDCRNNFESEIGRIEGAIRCPVKYFRDFPAYIDNNIELFKDKTVLMYCTAGVRCERASAYIKSKNIAQEVYHMKGGIHRYVEEYPDGFFKGKNYVFDGRTSVRVTDDILAFCFLCKAPCDDYTNCLRAQCNRHFICCQSCLAKYQNFCSDLCNQLVNSNQSTKRPNRIKDYSHGPTNICSTE